MARRKKKISAYSFTTNISIILEMIVLLFYNYATQIPSITVPQ